MDGGGTAYGAGKAGGPFDPMAFIKKPQVILRIASWLFAVIVFGCISSQGRWEGICQYNEDPNACGFGVAIGVLAFLGLIVLLVLDALFENISSIQQRKYAVLGDVIFSGVWTFLWFVNFCYLADSWRRTKDPPGEGKGVSGVEAAIAFSFFSIITFAALTALAVMRYRQGASDAFTTSYEPEGVTQPTPSPYSTYAGGETGDPYQQQPPFGEHEQKQPPPPGDFNPPTY
jgi:hypothetical protein